jgi:RHS repeat-associated protein
MDNSTEETTLFASYTYDALNRRIAKTVGSTITTYVYDHARIVQELENNVLKRSYIYAEYIDAPVALYKEDVTPSQVFYYLRDRRANVVGLVDAAGAIAQSYEYTPFGRVSVYDAAGNLIPSASSLTPFLFTGRQHDPESNLWHYRNRMYSDLLGRFLQRDPAGFVDGYNLYAYVSNNRAATRRSDRVKSLRERFRWSDPGAMGLASQQHAIGSRTSLHSSCVPGSTYLQHGTSQSCLSEARQCCIAATDYGSARECQ